MLKHRGRSCQSTVGGAMYNAKKVPSGWRLRIYQVLVLLALFFLWWGLTSSGVLPPFFFGEPVRVLVRIGEWFVSGDIFPHLAVTLVETVLAFVFGTGLGLLVGLWLALSPTAAVLADPYIKAANAMPRVILAPIFAVWFGLGIASKVALGITLVFFIVFFNVYQGIREVSPVVLANARMLGGEPSPVAAPCVPTFGDELGFLQLAHLGGYGVCRCGSRGIPGVGQRRGLPDPAGRGNVRHQHRICRYSCANDICLDP